VRLAGASGAVWRNGERGFRRQDCEGLFEVPGGSSRLEFRFAAGRLEGFETRTNEAGAVTRRRLRGIAVTEEGWIEYGRERLPGWRGWLDPQRSSGWFEKDGLHIAGALYTRRAP
jgi:hypothetical protein